MKISRKKRPVSIPTCSTSDIAFLLIIFFMATTKFDIKEGLSLVLPPAAEESAVVVKLSEKDMTRINVNPASEILINDKSIGAYNQIALDTQIKQKLVINPMMIFTIKTARDAKYNDTIRVLDRLKVAGVEKISLSTN